MSSSSPAQGVSREAGPAEPVPDALPAELRSAPRSVRYGALTVLLTLMRRELWEHRQLWLAPITVAVLVILCAFPSHPGLINLDFSSVSPSISGSPFSLPQGGLNRGGVFAALNADVRSALFGLETWLLTLPQYLVMVFVLSFYLTDCLFAERKDRSILFWKSLPVSDLAVVTSKAILGLVVVPLGVYVIALVTDLVFSGIWHLRAHLGAASGLLMPWDAATWLKMQGLMAIGILYSILWYAPLGGYLLFVSAWAKRNAILWASLPPLLAPIAERMAFGTSYLGSLLYYRSFGLLQTPDIQYAVRHAAVSVGTWHPTSLPMLLEDLPYARIFANIDLWLGVVVALAFILLAARIRRYRDDS
jgi:ABC-2 type transport system permease protein